MLGPQRWAVESEQPPALEDPIDDGVGEVLVMEHAAPGAERLVSGEEHGPAPAVAIIDDVEEHVGRVGAVGEVAWPQPRWFIKALVAAQCEL